MKILNKYRIIALAPIFAMVLALAACNNEDEANGGEPVIYYVRVTDPAKSDSLLVSGFMGGLISVIGENLSGTRELWFNDQKAALNPAYITNNTILVSVPSVPPAEVTDKMRLVFKNGKELTYDFTVTIPPPVLNAVKSEFVPDGDVFKIEGDFFFEPIEVIFPGDLEAEIVSMTKTSLEVIVPEGASPGNISVKTNFGSVKSKFLFRDDRNVILDFDTRSHENWTAPIEASSANPAIEGVSGNFAYFKHNAVGNFMWTNELTLQYWAPRGSGNIPLANGSINDLVLKFEVNVPIEWKEVRMEMFFGPYAEDHGRDLATTAIARWKPWAAGPFKTDGWVTVSIPLSEFKYYKDDADDNVNGTRQIENFGSLTNLTMMMFGPATATNPVFIAIDNVRIVQK